MAAAMAPTIAEFAMILLADDEVVVVELDGGPVVVGVVSELVETRGLVVVVIVVGPLVVVVVTPVAGVVAVVPVETTLLEELVRQLESVEVPTVKGAVCETAPVVSRKVNPREVPPG